MAQVEFQTSMGNFVIDLDAAKAPVSVENFLKYVDSGHFEGTIFHRIIPGFVVQGGGLDEAMVPKPTLDPIKNESGNGLSNVAMSLSMARTSALHSATCQFFINLSDNTAGGRVDLDRGQYAVFGKISNGADVIRQMEKVKTTSIGPYEDVPAEPITVLKVQRL
jgi:peptidyl-prolyl cis-trans isomerase B (cyclophilin B)